MPEPCKCGCAEGKPCTCKDKDCCKGKECCSEKKCCTTSSGKCCKDECGDQCPCPECKCAKH